MKSEKKSNRSFGILFFIVFIIIGFWPILSGESIRIWSLIISALFLFLGILNSKILTPLNFGWIKFGELLGKIIAPIVMCLIFFLILTPISFIVKILRLDLLKLKSSKENTYWLKRDKNIGPMKRQF